MKQRPAIADITEDSQNGISYKGAKEQYILDIDNAECSQEIIRMLEPVIDLPKPRKKKLEGK